jgi:hypothetical protein
MKCPIWSLYHKSTVVSCNIFIHKNPISHYIWSNEPWFHTPCRSWCRNTAVVILLFSIKVKSLYRLSTSQTISDKYVPVTAHYKFRTSSFWFCHMHQKCNDTVQLAHCTQKKFNRKYSSLASSGSTVQPHLKICFGGGYYRVLGDLDRRKSTFSNMITFAGGVVSWQ